MIVMLLLLLLPISSQYFFRVYDNQQLQKTEIELIAQSAVLAATYRLLYHQQSIQFKISGYDPIPPQLDLSHDIILPRRPKALITFQTPTQKAIQIGQMMQPILMHSQQITLAGMRILDHQGIVIAGRNEQQLSLAHIKEVQRALKGHYQAVIRERISDEPPPPLSSISRSSKIRIFTAFPIMEKGTVLGVVYLSRTPQNIAKYLYSIKETLFWRSIFILGFAMLLIYFISSLLAQPIKELTAQVRKVTLGEAKTIQLSKQPNTAELAELAHGFIKMSEALEARNHYIKDFASHVSHEFKTPLTSMQGALELLQDHAEEMSLEQKETFYHHLFDDIERLEHLVTRLLALARADAMPMNTDAVDLALSLKKIQSVYAKKQLNIIFNIKKTRCYLKIDADSFHTILLNLAENSLQHGASLLQITLKKSENKATLFFQDNGSGISKANQSKILTPFFTTRREQGGTGLGLGIITSLLQNVDGSIEVLKSNKGALLKIALWISIK